MPPFPERESSILAKLKKKKPEAMDGGEVRPSQASKMPTAQVNSVSLPTEAEKKPPEVFNSLYLFHLSGMPLSHQVSKILYRQAVNVCFSLIIRFKMPFKNSLTLAQYMLG